MLPRLAWPVKPGAVGRNWVDRADGRIETLDSQDSVEMHAGDAIVIETPGGGGYGEAESRNMALRG
jgi:5-oxoprolinase (ATP-hydrolysing)